MIGVLRQKYKILGSINTLMCGKDEQLSSIDKIVVVCAALCSCRDSVVPFD